jgi:putative endonuclease
MALGDAINLLLHQAGIGVDEEGDDRHGSLFAFPKPSWPDLFRPSTPCFNLKMAGGWVYFMTNRRNGVLYVGVTSNLPRRAFDHRQGLVDGFTKHHGLKRLVYMERFDDIRSAIQRETTIKHWPRAWKVRLIQGANPEWDDLYGTLI